MVKMEAKKQEKLERVLDQASELFANSEFHQVSMEDIATRAGVGKGTLYNLFESKEDLYFSIIRERLNQLLDILENTYNRRNDTMKNLRSLIIHLHKFMSKHRHFYRIWKREEGVINGSLKHRVISGLQDRIFDLVTQTLSRGETEGVICKGMDLSLIGRLLLGMIDGLRKSPEKVYQQERCIDDLLAVLIHGIGTEQADTRVTYEEYRHRSRKEGHG